MNKPAAGLFLTKSGGWLLLFRNGETVSRQIGIQQPFNQRIFSFDLLFKSGDITVIYIFSFFIHCFARIEIQFFFVKFYHQKFNQFILLTNNMAQRVCILETACITVNIHQDICDRRDAVLIPKALLL